jgi:3-hydroxybutyryl-CoA dehydrogenase
VQENIADVRDIDMAMIAGSGMTVGGDRIGPLALADKLGLDVVVAGLEDLEKKYGLRFHPADKLVELVKDGHLGEKTKSGFLEYV